ncbi:MAG: D5 N like protein family [Clostridium butyricum DORA_1]|nr:MAG: D5 N like protein family [Clostridium butyricum DORA_1]MDU1509966.1 hypothetical protein [Clostridium butyricum]
MFKKDIILNQSDYLKPYYPKRFNFIPRSCENLNEIYNNIKNESNLKRLVAACTGMKYGEHLFKLFMNRVAALNEEKIKLLYDNFRNQVTEEDVKASAEIVEELKKTSFLNMMADRGYFLVKGVFKFNSNIFARHFLERTDLIALNNNDIGIYNKKGYYERFDAESLVLGKIAHVIMNEVEGKDMWNSFDEKEGIRAIQRSTMLIKDLEIDRNLLNLSNGIFDLRTYELKNHSP